MVVFLAKHAAGLSGIQLTDVRTKFLGVDVEDGIYIVINHAPMVEMR
jgi:hypothetical protein|tara:strand:+ start:2183 stop:2323 length:141 start_codon:yes stop_codon:yes gene_type:complete